MLGDLHDCAGRSIWVLAATGTDFQWFYLNQGWAVGGQNQVGMKLASRIQYQIEVFIQREFLIQRAIEIGKAHLLSVITKVILYG